MSFPQVLTNGSRQAIIYTVNGGGMYPIHGAYWSGNYEFGWLVGQWDKDGFKATGKTSGLDISGAVQRGELNALFPKQEEQKIQDIEETKHV